MMPSFFTENRAMSRAKVQDCVRRARSESRTGEKLNAIAGAINAFVDYVEQMEHLLRTLNRACGEWRKALVWNSGRPSRWREIKILPLILP
jgi:hypothetical protein